MSIYSDGGRPATVILGGAERVRTRVRGFAPWRPQSETEALLEQVRRVLLEYAEYLPLTLRQIFYRLVGAHGYEKTERAYDRLGEHLNRARRARLISMDDIRDDGTTVIEPNAWDNAEQFLDSVRYQAGRIILDHSVGQITRLVVNCEAVGMAPQLGRIANPFGVKIISSGGFESTTERYNFARELADQDRPTEVLDIGDHDPSGVHKYLAFIEDVEAFVRELGGEVTFTRLAVTPEQIETYNLPTAPPKKDDKRAFSGETCQVEALAPDVLANILREAIEGRIDHDIYQRVLRREQRERRKLLSKLKGL
jgi:hypothetical protein